MLRLDCGVEPLVERKHLVAIRQQGDVADGDAAFHTRAFKQRGLYCTLQDIRGIPRTVAAQPHMLRTDARHDGFPCSRPVRSQGVQWSVRGEDLDHLAVRRRRGPADEADLPEE